MNQTRLRTHNNTQAGILTFHANILSEREQTREGVSHEVVLQGNTLKLPRRAYDYRYSAPLQTPGQPVFRLTLQGPPLCTYRDYSPSGSSSDLASAAPEERLALLQPQSQRRSRDHAVWEPAFSAVC